MRVAAHLGHGDGAAHVGPQYRELILNIAGVYQRKERLLGFVETEPAPLKDKAWNQAMDHGAVVGAAVHILQEVGDRAGSRVIEELDMEVPDSRADPHDRASQR